MANPHRGEVAAIIAGRRLTLCLTLGALAELEASYAAEGLAGLGRRLAQGGLGARDLVRIFGAGARGAGHAVTDEDIAGWPLDGGLEPVALAATALIESAFGAPETPPRPGPPQDAGPNPGTG